MVVKHPSITWAQRSPHVYLTIEVDNIKIDELAINGNDFKIRGTKGDETYEADLKFFANLKGNEHWQVATDRHVQLVIPKEKEEWWPRLLQEKTKVPWIKVDFNKWVDEDEETSEKEDFGGMGMGEMGGMGGLDFTSMGLGGNGMNFNGMNFGEDDGEDDDGPADLEDIEDDNAENGKVEKK